MSDDFGRPLTLKEVAHALNCSERTVRRMVSDRHFPPPRHAPGGKAYWFSRDVDVFRYLLARGHFETGEVPMPEEEEDND